MHVICHTETEMLALGQRLGASAFAGLAIGLSGDLGAGKTVLARGLARGLGIEGRVPSPTYVVIQTLQGGRLPLWHGDLYRLSGDDDLEQLGIDDLFEAGGVVVLEWAELFPDALPVDALHIHLELMDDTTEARKVTVTASGPKHEALLVLLAG